MSTVYAYRKYSLSKLKLGDSMMVPIKLDKPTVTVTCSLIAEEYVGLDFHYDVQLTAPSLARAKVNDGMRVRIFAYNLNGTLFPSLFFRSPLS